MKPLKDYINESLLDLDDIEISIDDVRGSVEKFLKENYRGNFTISTQPNKDSKFEVSSKGSKGNVEVSNKKLQYLTNDLFEFTTINGYFDCNNCNSLKSLEGAPKEVGGTFYCHDCNSLKSLEGAPKTVGGSFGCSNCISLISLKGAPREVGGSFSCSYCDSLESLEGAPKTVGGCFSCMGCKTKFTKEDVKKHSNVKKYIYD